MTAPAILRIGDIDALAARVSAAHLRSRNVPRSPGLRSVSVLRQADCRAPPGGPSSAYPRDDTRLGNGVTPENKGLTNLAVLWWRGSMTRFGIALPAGATGGSAFVASSLADAARAIEA